MVCMRERGGVGDESRACGGGAGEGGDRHAQNQYFIHTHRAGRGTALDAPTWCAAFVAGPAAATPRAAGCRRGVTRAAVRVNLKKRLAAAADGWTHTAPARPAAGKRCTRPRRAESALRVVYAHARHRVPYPLTFGRALVFTTRRRDGRGSVLTTARRRRRETSTRVDAPACFRVFPPETPPRDKLHATSTT